jgi:membrane protease YdiL (CAAX protease family)
VRFGGVGDLALSLLSLGAVLLATYVCLGWLEGKPWSWAGLGWESARGRLLVRGFLYGVLPIGCASAILIATGDLRIVRGNSGSSLLAAVQSFTFFAPAAMSEELLVRGYAFAVMRDAWGWRWALTITSVAFGLLHVANPGADGLSVMIVILAGFFLGGILMATRSLYAAGSAHLGWNWVMAGLLHTPVSGVPVDTPDYRVVDAGPSWLTGGSWGPEGGAAAGGAMMLVVFYLFARHLGRLRT